MPMLTMWCHIQVQPLLKRATVAMDAGGSFNQPKPSTDVLHKFQDQQKWWQSQQAQRGFVHLTGK
jgi:hypothetical protein